MRQPPHLVIADVVLPGMDGYTLCRRLRQTAITKAIPVLMLTSRGQIADKIAGFEAGADDYLTKPFQPQELAYRVKSIMARTAALDAPQATAARANGKIIALFGSKGGVGKTMIACNMAVALRRRTGKRIALFDADFCFGDANVHLNLPPVRSVLNLVNAIDDLDAKLIDQAMVAHPTGVRVLLSPFRPEEADLVKGEHVKKILDALVTLYDFIIVDCGANYDDRTLTALENADDIMLVVTPEIGPLKNAVLFLDVANKLGLSLDKVHVILNRANSNVGIEDKEIERTLRHPVAYRVISGGRALVLSVNRGVPLVIAKPDHPLAQQIYYIVDSFMAVLHKKAA